MSAQLERQVARGVAWMGAMQASQALVDLVSILLVTAVWLSPGVRLPVDQNLPMMTALAARETWSHRRVAAASDTVEIEALVSAAAEEESEEAWKRLWSVVEPGLARAVAQPGFLGRLGRQEDDRRNIVVEVMARLRADRFKRLRLYLDARRANPQLRFATWLRVVAKRVGVDYMRAHPDYIDRRGERDASTPGRWIRAETLPPASQLRGGGQSATGVGTARELLRWARDEIPDEQRAALERWVGGDGFGEIASALGLADPAEAERVVRAAVERLRRRFRADGDEP